MLRRDEQAPQRNVVRDATQYKTIFNGSYRSFDHSYTLMRIDSRNTHSRMLEVFSIAYIDKLYAIAYNLSMDTIARTTKQLGAAVRRTRRARKMTQNMLGQKMHARQATVSKLEAGEPATQLQTLMDALTALELELVIRPRTTVSTEEIEDLF
jgi:HTH-type transcriptional regulator / antitoxin HipB